jgi:hypothetical protein
MKDLNKVQEALEDKAKKELLVIVNDFYHKLSELEEKYNKTNWYRMSKINLQGNVINRQEAVSFSNANELANELHQMLIKKHLDKMVEIKTSELLYKLKLI